MKVLFLDIDGVLNSHAHWTRRGPAQRHIDENSMFMGGIDPFAIARLNSLVERTGAVVVVSSTIRRGYMCVELREGLALRGFVGTVLDKTPVIHGDRVRGREIDAWLALSRPVESFAIVDDDSDMEPHMARFVQTSCAEGLLDEHVDRLCELLGDS